MQTPYSCGRICRVQAQRGGIGRLNCPSKTGYYSMTRPFRPENSAGFCGEFVGGSLLWRFRAETWRGQHTPSSTLLAALLGYRSLPAKWKAPTVLLAGDTTPTLNTLAN